MHKHDCSCCWSCYCSTSNCSRNQNFVVNISQIFFWNQLYTQRIITITITKWKYSTISNWFIRVSHLIVEISAEFQYFFVFFQTRPEIFLHAPPEKHEYIFCEKYHINFLGKKKTPHFEKNCHLFCTKWKTKLAPKIIFKKLRLQLLHKLKYHQR